MKSIPTTELKAKLSESLARVREGEALYVTSHGKPVAELHPVLESGQLESRPPTRPVSDLKGLKGISCGSLNVDQLLAEDRARR